jgi:adenosylmethionine-8-amino-7-oxononanoate aminotransferase
MVRAATLAIFLIASTVVSSAESQNAATDARQRDAFLSELQRASRAGDRNTIAAMIRYPITIAIGGFRVPFRDAAAFLERYDEWAAAVHAIVDTPLTGGSCTIDTGP